MAVTVYRSTDSGAPVLTGAAGSLIAVLDACLVNGYGAKAAAGFSRPFSGANKAVYRASTGSQHYYEVDDSSGQAAMISGYETMTALSTGTNKFPSSTTYVSIVKSSVADASPRGWILVTNGTLVHFVSQYDTATNWNSGAYLRFGEFPSFIPAAQAWCGHIVGTNTGTTATSVFSGSSSTHLSSSYTTSTISIAVSRNYTGTTVAVSTARQTADVNLAEGGVASNVGAGGGPYPSPSLGGVLLLPMRIQETTAPYAHRGYIPGFWCLLHNRPFNHGDTFSGAGVLTGKTFEVVNAYTGAQLVFETSNTW